MSSDLNLNHQYDGKVRKKMDVGEGRSLIHWSRLKPNVKWRGAVKMSEVEKHKSKTDFWTVYRGKVYDMTSFLEYHPGGQPHLLMAAGKDGTKLFDKYHTWVNIDFILGKCCIGKLVGEDGKSEQVMEEDEEDEEDTGRIELR